MKKYISKASSYRAVGAIGLVIMASFSGCEQKSSNEPLNIPQNSEQGYFIVIQEVSPNRYKVVEQYPTSGTTRAILKTLDGKEKLLSKEELEELTKQEAQKIEEGTSRLTSQEGISNGGMSIGEAILASAAGAIIGSYIGNKLFNNPNFQNNVKRTMPSVKTPTKSSSFKSSKSSGFMKKSPSKSARRFSFGGSRFGG